MKFTPLDLEGAHLIDLEPHTDDRGFNARAWCRREAADAGLDTHVEQINVICNEAAGTLRGLHYQAAPHTETKVFRVTRGAIHDVIVDLRPGSPTYLQWTAVELRARDYRMLYVPAGFGQGFQTLEDDTELTYQVTAPYTPDAGRGFRHDDPTFGISWPLPVSRISQTDATWPDFDPTEHAHHLSGGPT